MTTSALATRRFSLFFISWWIVWSALHYLVLREMLMEPREAILESVFSTLLLAGISFVISNNMRYYQPGNDRWWYLLVISGTGSFLWLVLLQVTLKVTLMDADGLEFFRRTWSVRYATGFLLIGITSTFALLLYREQAEKETAARKNEVERLAKEAELLKLRQKLQPHFLFNSLNSISALVRTNPQKAREMIQQLSDFFRNTLRKEHHQLTTLREELEQLYLYLEIEKVRFGYRLQAHIDCTDDLMEAKIPAFILQPVVENAIKFGLYGTLDEVDIRVNIRRQGSLLAIDIQNPFDPQTSEAQKGTGFGLSAIKKQLYLLYARTDLLKTLHDEHTFTTQIFIPLL